LKVLLVNLLAALNFANVFLRIKKCLENKKKRQKRKKVTRIKKDVSYIYELGYAY